MKLNNYIQLNAIYNIKNEYFFKHRYFKNVEIFFFYIIIFIFFLFVLTAVFKKFFWYQSTSGLYISNKIYLSSTQYICILHISEMRLLLSVTDHTINLIYVLPPDSSDHIIKKKNFFSYKFFT